MKYTILYPSDYFDYKKADADYQYEYDEAVRFPGFQILFYNYDEFVGDQPLRVYPRQPEPGFCVYRGWMLHPLKYGELYRGLLKLGLRLVNSPEEYVNCHEFPNSYGRLKGFTPGLQCYARDQKIPWRRVRDEFPRFMMKDFVKSVKGTDFPVYFDGSYADEVMDRYVERFIELRGPLFEKGIVLKEYVDLKRLDGKTNEYRVFFLYHKVLSVSPNSCQTGGERPPEELIRAIPALDSNFYTVDFAQLENGGWTVIETGDGQVSGLSPDQFVFKYYEGLLAGLAAARPNQGERP